MTAVKTLDLDAVATFATVAALGSFTRTAEATGATQSGVSVKLKRLETMLGRRLIERTPRSVRLTDQGIAFLDHAKELLAANERALASNTPDILRLRLGISDHVAGPELPAMLTRLNAADPSLEIELTLGFSRALLDAFDDDAFDAVIVRKEASHRGGELLATEAFGWFASPSFKHIGGTPLRLANLAAPCGVRAAALRALDARRIPWTEVFIGGGVSAVAAAVSAGVGVAALATRLAPTGAVDVGPSLGLPRLPSAKVMLYGRISGARAKAALRTVAAAFRALT